MQPWARTVIFWSNSLRLFPDYPGVNARLLAQRVDGLLHEFLPVYHDDRCAVLTGDLLADVGENHGIVRDREVVEKVVAVFVQREPVVRLLAVFDYLKILSVAGSFFGRAVALVYWGVGRESDGWRH